LYLVDDEAEELAGARAGGEADGIVHLSAASCGKGGQRLHEKMGPGQIGGTMRMVTVIRRND